MFFADKGQTLFARLSRIEGPDSSSRPLKRHDAVSSRGPTDGKPVGAVMQARFLHVVVKDGEGCLLLWRSGAGHSRALSGCADAS